MLPLILTSAGKSPKRMAITISITPRGLFGNNGSAVHLDVLWPKDEGRVDMVIQLHMAS